MKSFTLVTLLLVSCSSGGGSHSHPIPVPQPAISAWTIGPVIDGVNYSKGMPAHPTMQGVNWYFDFPQSGHVDYVSGRPAVGPVVTMRFSVSGSGFKPANDTSNVPAKVGLCLQRKGDNWSGAGVYQQYRLFSKARVTLKAGEGQQLVASEWTDVQGKPVGPEVVLVVLSNLDNVAVVFGGQFAGHGVYSTEKSRFTMLEIH